MYNMHAYIILLTFHNLKLRIPHVVCTSRRLMVLLPWCYSYFQFLEIPINNYDVTENDPPSTYTLSGI